jgi:hypothetical protein
VILLPLPAIAWKEAVIAFQSWLMEAASGTGTAILRLASVLAIIAAPAWIGWLLRLLGVGSVQILDLPLLDAVNQPVAPLVVVAAAIPLFALASWIRCWPPLHVRLPGRDRGRPAARAQRPGRRFSREPQRAMLAFELTQALRVPAYRYAFIMLGTFAVLTFWIPRPSGASLLTMTAFLGPMSGIFNLYGASARYHTLWLALGVPLQRWTRVRLAFAIAQMLVLATSGIVLATVTGILPLRALPGVLALPVAATAPAMVFGPRISRFVLTPAATEIGRSVKGARSGRSFIPTLAAALIGVVIGLPGFVLALTGYGWVCWLAAVALVGGALLLRPGGASWTPDLRSRMEQAFRA